MERRCYSVHPPILPEEQRCLASPLQLKVKSAFGVAPCGIPRSTHVSVHPRTHSMYVWPAGASTRNSKLGADTCARPATHPIPINAAATTAINAFLPMVTSSVDLNT